MQSSGSVDNICSLHRQDSVPTLATAPPAMVTPIHKPIENPSDLPMEILLDGDFATEAPQPDSLIAFEGQQFHYLDPSSFTGESLNPARSGNRAEWTANDFPLNDVIMVLNDENMHANCALGAGRRVTASSCES